jgi:putative oxidoreductase
MKLTRQIPRTFLAAVFVTEGSEVLRDPAPRVKVSEDVSLKLARMVGLPEDPELLVKVNAGVQVCAGLLLSIGRFRRLSALALIGSIIPTTYAGHRFWAIEDPVEHNRQKMHFMKNLGLLGGLMLELFDTDGAPSLGWRARRRAELASAALANLRGDGGHRASELGEHLNDAVHTAARVGAATGEHLQDAAHVAARVGAVTGEHLYEAATTAARVGASTGEHLQGAVNTAARVGSVAGEHLLASSREGSKQARRHARHASRRAAKAASQLAVTARSHSEAVRSSAGTTTRRATSAANELVGGSGARLGELWGSGGKRAGALVSNGARRAAHSWQHAAKHLQKSS